MFAIANKLNQKNGLSQAYPPFMLSFYQGTSRFQFRFVANANAKTFQLSFLQLFGFWYTELDHLLIVCALDRDQLNFKTRLAVWKINMCFAKGLKAFVQKKIQNQSAGVGICEKKRQNMCFLFGRF